MDKKKIENFLEKPSFVFFVLQIAFMFYMNFFQIKHVIDFDSSSALELAREIALQGKIIPENYGFQTTLDVQTLAIPVAIIYKICGNLVLSQSIMNNVIILVFIYCIWAVLRHIDVPKLYKWLCLILYFCPYSVDQLGWVRMLYTAGAFYTHRMLMPILLAGILLDEREGKKLRYYIVRLVYLLVLSFFSCLGSGMYTMLCAVCPFIAWELVRVLKDNNFKGIRRNGILIEVAVLIASMAGVAGQKICGVSTLDSNMYMTSGEDFASNLAAIPVGIIRLFGGVPERDDVSLFSFLTVNLVANFVVSMAVMAAIVYCVVKAFRSKEEIYGYCLMMIAVNMTALILIYTSKTTDVFQRRYHIITLSLIFFVVVMMLKNLADRAEGIRYIVLILCIAAVSVTSVVMSDARWVLRGDSESIDEALEINGMLEKEGIETAVFVGGDKSLQDGRRLRPFSEKVHYLATGENIDNTYFMKWGATLKYIPKQAQPGRVVTVVEKGYENVIPESIKSTFTTFASTESYELYVSETTPYDFR